MSTCDFRVDAQAAKRERDTASYGVGLEGGRVDGVRPVAFVHGKTRRPPPILDVRIEWDVGAHGFIPFPNRPEEFGRVYPIELLGQILDSIRRLP